MVRPFPECVQTDNIRLVPKMDELLDYTDKMETILRDNAIPYTVIDVLDLKERVKIVKEKILEYNGLKFSTRTEKEINLIRDDWYLIVQQFSSTVKEFLVFQNNLRSFNTYDEFYKITVWILS